MAVIKAFRGVRYNPEKVGELDKVISQPYDRVREGLQEKYYDLHEYNIVRIIKGMEHDGDDDANNVYTRARDYYREWLDKGVLRQEDKPALYVYHQSFTVNGVEKVRKGFIGAFQLAAFDEGIVLPHERTHAGPKVDRLNLLRNTTVNFGQIFMLYPDMENKVNAILDEAVAGRAPDVDVVELYEKDVKQQVWAVTDPDVIAKVQAEFAPMHNLIIADGHHRYETALNYRDEMREKYPDAPADAAFNYRMVTFVSMGDPDLVILPTHRAVSTRSKISADEVLEKAREHFAVEKAASLEACVKELSIATAKDHFFGFYAGDDYYILKLKDVAVMDELVGDERIQEWKELDVSILHELLLDKVVGVNREDIEAKTHVRYLREVEKGVDSIDSDEHQFLFILNPTRIDRVRACSEKSEKMPQKSTDFYPKMITGLTMMPVGEFEI